MSARNLPPVSESMHGTCGTWNLDKSFQFGSQGFTRSEQECKNPGNGVGWLALAITSESFDCNVGVSFLASPRPRSSHQWTRCPTCLLPWLKQASRKNSPLTCCCFHQLCDESRSSFMATGAIRAAASIMARFIDDSLVQL